LRAALRKQASVAFANRNRRIHTPRGATVTPALRRPEPGETPLSDHEIWHGVQRGLISIRELQP
jgi:hypothetical protein